MTFSRQNSKLNFWQEIQPEFGKMLFVWYFFCSKFLSRVLVSVSAFNLVFLVPCGIETMSKPVLFFCPVDGQMKAFKLHGGAVIGNFDYQSFRQFEIEDVEQLRSCLESLTVAGITDTLSALGLKVKVANPKKQILINSILDQWGKISATAGVVGATQAQATVASGSGEAPQDTGNTKPFTGKAHSLVDDATTSESDDPYDSSNIVIEFNIHDKMKSQHPHMKMFVVAIDPKKSVCELLHKTAKYLAEYEVGSFDFKQVIKFDEQYLTNTWKTVLSCGFTADDTNKAIIEIYGADDPAFASIMESAIIPNPVEAWTVMDEKKFKLLADFAEKGIHLVDMEGTHKDIVTRKLANTLDGMAGKSINEKMEGDKTMKISVPTINSQFFIYYHFNATTEGRDLYADLKKVSGGNLTFNLYKVKWSNGSSEITTYDTLASYVEPNMIFKLMPLHVGGGKGVKKDVAKKMSSSKASFEEKKLQIRIDCLGGMPIVQNIEQELGLFLSKVEADAKGTIEEYVKVMPKANLEKALNLLDTAKSGSIDYKAGKVACLIMGESFTKANDMANSLEDVVDASVMAFKYGINKTIHENGSFNIPQLRQLIDQSLHVKMGMESASVSRMDADL